MNEMQKIYCDGAAMAYRDNAQILRRLGNKAKADLKMMAGNSSRTVGEVIASVLETVANANETKADEVCRQAETFASGVRQ